MAQELISGSNPIQGHGDIMRILFANTPNKLDQPGYLVNRARRTSQDFLFESWTNIATSISRESIEPNLLTLTNQVSDISDSVESLQNQLNSCETSIETLRSDFADRPIIKETQLFDIGEGFLVLSPIPVVLEETEEEVAASFPEVEVFAVGTGEAEAIHKLKIVISELFLELVSAPDSELGKIPKSWKRILTRLIRQNG